MTSKKTQTAESVAEKLLDLLGIKGTISTEKEDEATRIVVETEETGILIGWHGETISALELILNQIVNRGREEWQRIVVDTGDYRAKQEDRLKNLSLEAAEKVKSSGEPYSLYELTPAQRRFVHMILAEDPALLTESEGEGRERRLVIKLRN